MLRDVNIRIRLILSYIYSTMAMYRSSAVRAVAPSWLKINYSFYFCLSVFMSVLPSGVSLSFLFPHLCHPSPLPFVPSVSLACLPYLSLAPLTSFIFLGLVCAVSAAAAMPVLVPARGTFLCMKLTCEAPPDEKGGFRWEGSHWIVSAMGSPTSAKGN